MDEGGAWVGRAATKSIVSQRPMMRVSECSCTDIRRWAFGRSGCIACMVYITKSWRWASRLNSKSTDKSGTDRSRRALQSNVCIDIALRVHIIIASLNSKETRP